MEFQHSHLTRHIDIINPEQLAVPIHIIGAGAIGSFAALMLAKMGATDITVWDNDIVSIENMSCQFYRFKDIGTKKVTALAAIIEDFTGVKIKAIPIHWDAKASQDTRGLVISAADSMEVRKDLFNYCKKDYRIRWFMDTRMGAETALMYVMQPDKSEDCTSYANSLYEEKDAVQEKCTAKSTIYTANMLSGHLVKAVKDCLTKQEYPRITQWSIKHNEMQVYRGGV